MRILLATDLHIGYMEKDQIRQMDTFQTLDEILSIAKKQEVDFILLGGDLFHENKPSRFALYNTSLLFRRYCFGDRPCAIEFLSDQSINFPDLFSQVNYQDPNFNVAIPVFSIHGNHDDPAGEGGLSAMDLLHITGLVNYFGKQPEIDDITVHPILLKKGSTRLALYGIGNVRDERLHRCFNKHRVKLMRPAERSDDWFNLMVLHQNRVARGASSYIPENYLASFLDLVLWGHEHDCRIDPEKAVDNDFYITQPGSSVATSLIEGEAIPKHVGILSIQGREFTIEKIRLKTVRPFVTDEVILGEVEPRLRPTDQKGAARFLTDTINEMIQRAKNEYREVNRAENQTDGNAEISDAEIPLPLVRLKVEYSGGYTTFNPQRFGQAFVGKVANPKDILVFHRKREMNNEKGPGKAIVEEPDLEALLPAKMSELQVEDLVNEYLEAQKLEVLAENAFGDAVRVFVDKEEVTAIKE
ncbi:Mre11 DNA-binding presumed domain-containing protein [Cladochytrium replicatum]|nr:Mre11 DNA-binding presumed domain-containing protein [Cladochytrium replicatum]